MRPMIDKHDLEYRLEQGREFLEQGHKVQVVCIFRGRQMDAPRARHARDAGGRRDARGRLPRSRCPPRLMGRRMTMLLTSIGHHQGAKPAAKAAKPAAKGAPERAERRAAERPPGPARPAAGAPLRPASAGEAG